MKCPRCTVALVIAHRDGVEIDYCNSCQGVWLDKGELDKVISRASRPDAGERRNDQENPLMDLFDMFGG